MWEFHLFCVALAGNKSSEWCEQRKPQVPTWWSQEQRLSGAAAAAPGAAPDAAGEEQGARFCQLTWRVRVRHQLWERAQRQIKQFLLLKDEYGRSQGHTRGFTPRWSQLCVLYLNHLSCNKTGMGKNTDLHWQLGPGGCMAHNPQKCCYSQFYRESWGTRAVCPTLLSQLSKGMCHA